jgi:hypothetical protein
VVSKIHKRILLLLVATFSTMVNANTIVVYGVGIDRESAKKDAFRIAIENVCGVAVLSDKKIVNHSVQKNEVTTYSSCYVENYKILKEYSDKLQIQVTVRSNSISSRLLSESNRESQFDTNSLKSQLDTLKDQQATGDKLVDAVFSDYPYRAYNLNKVKDPYIISDDRRKIYLMVPYDITWNYNFISAINDTFSLFQSNNGNGVITVMAKNPKNLILGKRNFYQIDDLKRLDHIKSKFNNENEMRLKVQANDNKGNRVLNVCFNPEYKAGGIFYSAGVRNQLTIFGNDRNTGTMKINLTIPADVIYDVYVDVIPQRDCKL